MSGERQINRRPRLEPYLVAALPACTDDVVTRIPEPSAGSHWPEGAYWEIVYRLAAAAEFRDDETGNHIARMASYAYLIGQELGLGDDFLSTLLLASPMHDVGKIGIPDAILLKPGRLTRAEFEVVKDHALIGARLLQGSQSLLLRMAETIARTHHELYDGQGYPFGLSGEAIPLAGRIAAVADVFDALTSRRPYKEAYAVEVAVRIIRRGSGSRFDPEVVQAFRRALSGILEVKGEFEDHGPTQGRGSSASVGGGVAEKLAATEERFLRTREPSRSMAAPPTGARSR